MTNHVPTLETSKKLKAAGFPQETHFYHYSNWLGDEQVEEVAVASEWEQRTRNGLDDYVKACAAPLLTELLEQLPQPFQMQHLFDHWELVCNDKGENIKSSNDNPAEAAALLWLELQEQS